MEWKDISGLENNDIREGTKCLVEYTRIRVSAVAPDYIVGSYQSVRCTNRFENINEKYFTLLRYCIIELPPRRLRACPFPGCTGGDITAIQGLNGNLSPFCVWYVLCESCEARGPTKLIKEAAEAAWGYQD